MKPMTLDDVMRELAAQASETTKRTLLKHGATEPIFGVRIGDMKPLVKLLKGNQDLALQLYETGNSDAMYLAGLVADGRKMSRAQVDQWAKKAPWHMIAGCTVPWVASEHPDAIDIAVKWIDSPKELIATAGWATLASVVMTRADADLPIQTIANLLDRVAKTLTSSANRVRYAMNNFVICCGTYVAPLGDEAIATARMLGKVNVEMGSTDCKVPDAESYIIKSRRGAPVAPKRKTARC